MPIATTARGAIRYLRAHSTASGRPLLLIHGAGGGAMSWPPELRRLAGQPVYAVDLPGPKRARQELVRARPGPAGARQPQHTGLIL